MGNTNTKRAKFFFISTRNLVSVTNPNVPSSFQFISGQEFFISIAKAGGGERGVAMPVASRIGHFCPGIEPSFPWVVVTAA